MGNYCFIVATNQIHDFTYNGKFVNDVSSASPQCVLCEFIMKEIDDKLKDKNDEVNIKNCGTAFSYMFFFRMKLRKWYMEFATIYRKQFEPIATIT